MAVTYDKIATTTLGSAQSSVTFSSISGSYTDLVLVIAGSATTTTDLGIQVNGSNTSYSYTTLGGTGAATFSKRRSNADYIIPAYGSSATLSSTQSTHIIQFMNYSNSTTYKTMLLRANDTSLALSAEVALWSNTSAITSIVSYALGTTFTSGSTFTLYGIKAA